jgi:hypothetical protein
MIERHEKNKTTTNESRDDGEVRFAVFMQLGQSQSKQPDVVFIGGFKRLAANDTLELLSELLDVLLNVVGLIAVGKCVAVDKFVAGAFKFMVDTKWNHGVKIPDDCIASLRGCDLTFLNKFIILDFGYCERFHPELEQ